MILACVPLGLALTAGAVLLYGELARVVDDKFAGRRWDFPSRVYGDEFLVYAGLDLEAARVVRRLERLDYQAVTDAPSVGGRYRRLENALEVAFRAGPNGRRGVQRVRLELTDGFVVRMVDLDSGEDLHAVTIEPEELTAIYTGNWEGRRAVRVVDVAPILIRAILATEDRRFFEHRGVDVVGVGRALVTNIRSGRVRQGGSTLTQQLIKNFFLSRERTIQRKLREMAMALVAEHRYSKMQILENYLNEIYLGQQGARGIFGVAAAAEYYFAKSVRELDAADAALLAGLVRAPNLYSPFRQPEKALERRNTVLGLLHDAGEIDETTYRAAVEKALEVVPPRRPPSSAPYFVEYVKRELERRFSQDVLTGEGLRIYTTLDPILQEAAEKSVREGLAGLEKKSRTVRKNLEKDRLEAALVSIAPRTGEIRALVGGRDYLESQFDRATQARRQPGSAFKPIVFLAGLVDTDPDRHITPTTILDDSPFTWKYDGGKQSWTPSNYKRSYRGEVTVRTALEGSLNAAAAHVARAVGLDPIVELARQLGLDGEIPAVPSLVLGSVEVSPMDLTAIYSVFASGGIRADPRAIKRVEARDGTVLVGEPLDMEAVVSPEAAYVMTHLLAGVLDRGTARGARKAGFLRPAAGKTGTTNDNRDAWFIGYTADLVAGVWVGFDRLSPLDLTGASAALPIWVDFMAAATAPDPAREFNRPPSVRMVEVDRASGEVATVAEARTGRKVDAILEAFLPGDEPVWGDPLDLPSRSFSLPGGEGSEGQDVLNGLPPATGGPAGPEGAPGVL